MTPSLADYQKMLKDSHAECRWCTPLDLSSEEIEHYPHSDGWEVSEFSTKQWLYVTCPKCKYQWALWKLGIVRPKGIEVIQK